MLKEELTAVRHLKNRAGQLEKQLQSLKFLSLSVTKLRETPPCKGLTSKVEAIAIKLLDTQNELATIDSQIDAAKKVLLGKILGEADDPIQQTLLILYYVECLSFRAIAKQLGYSLRQTFRLHDDAFKNVIRCNA